MREESVGRHMSVSLAPGAWPDYMSVEISTVDVS